jgi:hypothetical protein
VILSLTALIVVICSLIIEFAGGDPAICESIMLLGFGLMFLREGISAMIRGRKGKDDED